MAFGNKVESKPEAKASGKAPVKHFRCAGGLDLAVWENSGKEGRTFNTFTVDRSYKTEKGFEKTNSLRLEDLPKVAMLLMKAFEEGSMKEDSE